MIVTSVEDRTGGYCIDFIEDANGAITFKLFRKDPEDYGRWSMIADYSRTKYATLADAVDAAKMVAPWFDRLPMSRIA